MSRNAVKLKSFDCGNTILLIFEDKAKPDPAFRVRVTRRRLSKLVAEFQGILSKDNKPDPNNVP